MKDVINAQSVVINLKDFIHTRVGFRFLEVIEELIVIPVLYAVANGKANNIKQINKKGLLKMERQLNKDQYDMVMAIKQGKANSLMENFQEYWKKHCWNNQYLSIGQTHGVLSNFAIEVFDKTDWRFVNDKIIDHFMTHEALSKTDLNELILRAINMLRMNY
jgi:hypothetical protein